MPQSDNFDHNEIYSAYAAGTLDPAFSLMVATQAALRPSVERAVARAESIAGAFLENETPTELSDGALDRAMALIDSIEPERRDVTEGVMQAGYALSEILDLPEPLRSSALEACGQSGWRALSSGVKRLNLDTGSESTAELYRIEPGQMVPRHSHSGEEYTLVVTGGFSDETGHHVAGDLCVKDAADTHQPIGDDDGVCYALAIRNGGLKFTGALGLIQRLIGQ